MYSSLQHEVDSALNVICTCLCSPGVPTLLRSAAASALYNSLPFVQANFEDSRSHERDALVNAMLQACSDPDEEIVLGALQCVERIAELYYNDITVYMPKLASVTSVNAKHPNENIATAAIRFWQHIAEQESSLDAEESKRYCQVYGRDLVNLLLELISTTYENEETADEEDEYGRKQAAEEALMYVISALNDDVMPLVMPFAQANFTSAVPAQRDAAVMIIALLQGSISDEKAAPIAQSVVQTLLQRLAPSGSRESSLMVRTSIGFALAEIFEYNAKFAVPKDAVESVMRCLIAALDDKAIVVKQITRAIDNLVTSYSELDEYEAGDGTIFSSVFFDTINSLIIRSEKPDWNEHELRVGCLAAIASIVSGGRTRDVPVMLGLITDTLGRLSRSVARLPSLKDKEREAEILTQESLLGMLDCIVMCPFVTSVMSSDPDNLNALGAQLLAACCACIDNNIGVLESWSLVASIARHLLVGPEGRPDQSPFLKYEPEIIPRLFKTLGNPAEGDNCRSALFAVSDISRNLGRAMNPDYLTNMVQALVFILAGADTSRDLKPIALGAIGDLSSSNGERMFPFLPRLLETIAHAAEIDVLDLTDLQRENEDEVEFLNSLKSSCLEAWSGIVQGISLAERPPAELLEMKKSLLQAFSMPVSPQGESTLQVIRRLSQKWIARWQELVSKDAESIDSDTLGHIKHLIGLFADITLGLGKEHAAAVCRKSEPSIAWLVRYADHVERQSDSYDPSEGTQAAYFNSLYAD